MAGRVHPAIAWRHAIVHDPALDSKTKLVALILADFVGDDGTAFPSRRTLANKAAASVSTVDRALQILRRAGFVSKASGGGRRLSNTYTVTIPETASERSRLGDQTASQGRRLSEKQRLAEAGPASPGLRNGVTQTTRGFTVTPELEAELEKELGGELGDDPTAVCKGPPRPPTERTPPIVDDCMRCSERRTIFDHRGRWLCLECVHTETGVLEQQLRDHIPTLRAEVGS